MSVIYLFLYSAAVILFLYFLWFLFWPEVEANVKNAENYVLQSSLHSFKINMKKIEYTYVFNGVKFSSNRQGLFMINYGFPHNKFNNNFKLKVCPLLPNLCCPNRVFYEGVVLTIQLLFCGLALLLLNITS